MIKVFAIIIGCVTPDLTHCVEYSSIRFDSPGTCRDSLAALVVNKQREVPTNVKVMGICKYVLVKRLR